MASKIDFKPISYLLGILSIVFAFFFPFAGLTLGIIGLIQSNKIKFQKARKLNVIGIILGAVFALIEILIQFYLVDINKLFPVA